jgi:hypothetical protein
LGRFFSQDQVAGDIKWQAHPQVTEGPDSRTAYHTYNVYLHSAASNNAAPMGANQLRPRPHGQPLAKQARQAGARARVAAHYEGPLTWEPSPVSFSNACMVSTSCGRGRPRTHKGRRRPSEPEPRAQTPVSDALVTSQRVDRGERSARRAPCTAKTRQKGGQESKKAPKKRAGQSKARLAVWNTTKCGPHRCAPPPTERHALEVACWECRRLQQPRHLHARPPRPLPRRQQRVGPGGTPCTRAKRHEATYARAGAISTNN